MSQARATTQYIADLANTVQAHLAASPVPAMLHTLQAAHLALISADSQELRKHVGLIGRLLGRDLELSADAAQLQGQLRARLVTACEIQADTQQWLSQLRLYADDLHTQANALAAQSKAEHGEAYDPRSALAWQQTAAFYRSTADNTADLLARFANIHATLQPLLAQNSVLARSGLDQSNIRASAKALSALETYISQRHHAPHSPLAS